MKVTGNDKIDEVPRIISVLITAFNRKEFIMDSINSVVSQSIGHSFEVIVVKNFLDKEIDQFISSKGMKTILVGQCSVGLMLRIAIENAKGDIISFLDDDDLFAPRKLEIIEDIFNENSDLIFFHNSQQRFLSKDLSNIIGKSGMEEKPSLTKIRVNEYSIKTLAKLAPINRWGEFYFNLSSVSIRKTYYITLLDYLEKITGHTDDFFFFYALDNHCDRIIINSTEKLTLYRVHESTSQHIENNPSIHKKIEISEIHLNSTRIIRNTVRYNSLGQILNYKIFSEAVDLSIYSKDFDKLRKDYHKVRTIIQLIFPLCRILPLNSLIIVYKKYFRFVIEIKRAKIKKFRF